MRTEQELLQALQRNVEGAVAVTSTVRAARALRRHYDEWQHATGNSGWVTPRVMAWAPWLERLWDAAILTGAEDRVLLTELQELEIWNTVLAQDAAATQTLSIDRMAELAQHAWKQMHQYRIQPRRLRGVGDLDAKAFYSWAAEFEKVCRKFSFLSPSLLEGALAEWIESKEISLPAELFLVGFDRATPVQTFLIDTLIARGCSAQFVELQRCHLLGTNQTLVYAQTLEEEIAATAHWIRDALLRNPTQRIGVVVPSLEEMRGAIDRTFRRVLAPSSMDIRAQGTSLPYEFSLGTPMFRLQPIRTALTILKWLGRGILPEEVSWLLVHGGWGARANESRDARARLDSEFRERDFQMGGAMPLSDFRQWLSRSGNPEESATLRQTMDRVIAIAKKLGMEKPRSLAEWREIIEELLDAARWHLLPAETSSDYQMLQRWNALLNDLSSLNSVTRPAKFSAVLEKLEHIAAHMLFTLETRNAPVQILGVSESAGLVFDSVWWLNARASVWPPHGKAQPFLPWSLQREARMPYANPTEDSAFALRTTKRILCSGTTAVVSFALEDVDQKNSSAHIFDREIILSPLVREALPDTSLISVEKFLGESSRSNVALESNLETIQEEAAVPFKGTKVRGGVHFLELHAACPFRAFAELRLGTRPLAELGTGLSPAVQGTIIHQVLEQVWKELKSRKNLLETATEQLRENLRRYIRQVLEEFLRHASEPWQQTLLQIEAERLEIRLIEWLEQEKQRADFTVIETENKLDNRQLGGIELECRIDRMDRVEQGVVLLDYKTGRIDRGSCDGERPDQPQLPAYAILRNQELEDKLAGVAFASLHPRRVGFNVVGSLPSIFSAAPQVKCGDAEIAPETRSKSKRNPAALSADEMKSQREAWRLTLTRMAEEFQAGVAIVDPKKQAETCKYCAQSLLCRIREAAESVENASEENSDLASMTEDFE